MVDFTTVSICIIADFTNQKQKSSLKVVKQNFCIFSHRGIRNKKLKKVKKNQVWFPLEFFSKGQITTAEERGHTAILCGFDPVNVGMEALVILPDLLHSKWCTAHKCDGSAPGVYHSH